VPLVITDPFPPGFFLGPLQIRFYGVAYAIAFIVGTAVATRHLARKGVDPDLSGRIAFCCLTPVIHKTFQIMGLANYATIFETEDAAIKELDLAPTLSS